MNRELQAFWAWRGWLETVAETLGLLGSDRPLQSLRLNVSVEDTIQQQEHADLFYRLTLRSASKRAWSMSIYDVAPYNWLRGRCQRAGKTERRLPHREEGFAPERGPRLPTQTGSECWSNSRKSFFPNGIS